MARPEPFPLRGRELAERSAHAALQATDRRLCGKAGLQHRMTKSDRTENEAVLDDGSSSELLPTEPVRQPVFEYAPAPESRAIVHLRSSYGLFIGGEFVEPTDGGAYKTENPATEEVLAEIAAAGPRDVDLAVEEARRAQR